MYEEIANEYFNKSKYLYYSIVVFEVEVILTILFLILQYCFQNIALLFFVFLLFLLHLFLFDYIYDVIFLERDKKRMKLILENRKISLKKYREFSKSKKDFKFPIPIPWSLVSVLFISYVYQFYTTPIPKTMSADEFIETNYKNINLLIAMIFFICCILAGCLYTFEVFSKIYNKYHNLDKIVDALYFK